jgi:glycosyltransferase involved in cell wall biosynthesis
VSSPVKIAEYLGCGLPVILTHGIGEYSNLILNSNLGLVLDETEDTVTQLVEYIRKTNLNEIKERASTFALQNFTFLANLDRYGELYRL